MEGKKGAVPFMKATIRSIAAAAGVSRGTVDRVLNNRPHVDPEVRQRVLRIAAEQGYRHLEETSDAALRIGVLIARWEDLYFTEQTRIGVQRALRRLERQNVELVVEEMNSRSNEEYIRRCESMREAGVDGLVLNPPNNLLMRTEFERLLAGGMQIVTYNSRLDGVDYLCHVGQDLEQSGRIAAGLMLRVLHGQGRILIVTGNMEFTSHRRRVDGFCALLRERGFPDERYDIAASYEQVGLTAELVAKAIEKHADLRGIYMATESVRGCMEALDGCRPRDRQRIHVVCNDLTPLNRRLLRAERLDFVIDQDFPSQVCEAILTLEEKLVRGRSPRTVVEHVSTSVITPEMV